MKSLSPSTIFKKLSLYHYLWLLCLIFAISSIVFFVYNVNYFQVDFGWHIASSTMFQKYGLHGWMPNWFQGLINNLFYPPLEDTIVWIVHSLFSTTNVTSFVIYVSLVIFGYWMWIFKLIRANKHRTTAIAMFLWLWLYFFLDKTADITYFQWGWFFDLVYTWLASQSLWTIFFLFFVAEYIQKEPNPWKLWLFSILTFLAHLVIGPVVFLMRWIFILHHFKPQHIYAFLLSLGVTSFFWLPFAAYKSLSISSFIYFAPPLVMLILSLVFAIIAYRKNLIACFGLFLTSILIILPNYCSARWYDIMGYNLPIPVFHYYRFASIALLCCIIWVVILFDRWYTEQEDKQKAESIFLWSSVLFILLFLIVYHFGIVTFSHLHDIIGERNIQGTETVKIDQYYPMLNNGKKIFTIDMYRPIDFGIDSYFQYMTPGLPFVKWLFRESSKGNQLISSYISTLISKKNMVLDFYISIVNNQSEYNKLWDSFVDQYNIGRIFMAPKNDIQYIPAKQASMLSSTFASGTMYHDFVLKDHLVIQGISYAMYEIVPKNNSTMDGFIRPLIHTNKIIPLVNDRLFADQILNMYKQETWENTQYIFFDKKNLPSVDTKIPYSDSYIPKYTLVDWIYTIDLWSAPQSVIMRLPDLPWWTFEGDQGQKITVLNWLYEKIVSGTWIVTIAYHRPFIMIFSYMLSLLSFGVFTYLWYRYKKH